MINGHSKQSNSSAPVLLCYFNFHFQNDWIYLRTTAEIYNYYTKIILYQKCLPILQILRILVPLAKFENLDVSQQDTRMIQTNVRLAPQLFILVTSS